MKINFSIVTALFGVLVSGCATLAENESLRFSADGEQTIKYTASLAVPSTRVEPLPTSYVLFPSFKTSSITIINPSVDQLRSFVSEEEERERQHIQRVASYCEGHYRNFPASGDVADSDPYGNYVKTFMLVETSLNVPEKILDQDGDLNISKDELEKGCQILANNYDFSRADALLLTFEQLKESDLSQGPIMVFDMGFDSIVESMEDVPTDKLDLVAPNWELRMDQALRAVENSRQPLIARRQEIENTISQLELKKNTTEGLKTSEKELLKELKKELKKISKKLFAENGWGRKLACGFGSTVGQFAGSLVPGGDILTDKIDDWCDD